MSAARRVAIVSLAAVVVTAGCEPYRIEYHERPPYYEKASAAPLPDRIELDDGTTIVYRTRGQPLPAAGGAKDADERQFLVREEMDDGTIVLRALMPEHVLGNLLNCLRNREYELIWDQLLSDYSKMLYESEGLTRDDFVQWCAQYRIDLAKTANRMILGLATGDTVVEPIGNGVVECRFWPQIAEQFKFKRVLIVNDRMELGLKLLSVR